MWVGQQTMDPSDMESKFANEDGMSFLGSIFESADDETKDVVEKIRNILDDLPEVEGDFIELYFFQGMKQLQIAKIFGVSQPTVCYRLARAAERIRYLVSMPPLDKESTRNDLKKVIKDDVDVEIMLEMLETTCQSEVAKNRGVTQGLVRHRFVRSLKILQTSDGMERYSAIFESVAKNLNVLREVRRPGRVQCVID
jgi:predicted transcriptional regulator